MRKTVFLTILSLWTKQNLVWAFEKSNIPASPNPSALQVLPQETVTQKEENKVGDFKIIYQGKNVAAKYLYFGGDKLFINFQHVLPSLSLQTPGTPDTQCTFALEFSQKNKIDTILVGSYLNDWYQTPEMNKIIDLINSKSQSYQKIITYGASMGGWAALAFSKALKADAVIAFCPQVLLEKYPAYTNFYKENNPESNDKPKTLFEIPTGLSQTAELFCFYGAQFSRDKEYVENDLRKIAKEVGNINLFFWGIPWKCHYVMTPLAKIGILSRVVLDIKDGHIKDLQELLIKDGENWRKMEQISQKEACEFCKK